MATKMTLGEVVQLPLREVWEFEDRDFTPWLSENIDLLSDAIGVQIEVDSIEQKVGEFRLDIIGRDLDDNVVIIENQLEQTDHSHLGQLMTYFAGTDASKVVWVARSFRPEHAAALAKLNEIGPEDIEFYGVEVSVIQIGDSAAAPVLNVVVRPSAETKATSASASRSRKAKKDIRQSGLYEFWRLMVYTLFDNHQDDIFPPPNDGKGPRDIEDRDLFVRDMITKYAGLLLGDKSVHHPGYTRMISQDRDGLVSWFATMAGKSPATKEQRDIIDLMALVLEPKYGDSVVCEEPAKSWKDFGSPGYAVKIRGSGRMHRAADAQKNVDWFIQTQLDLLGAYDEVTGKAASR